MISHDDLVNNLVKNKELENNCKARVLSILVCKSTIQR